MVQFKLVCNILSFGDERLDFLRLSAFLNPLFLMIIIEIYLIVM